MANIQGGGRLDPGKFLGHPEEYGDAEGERERRRRDKKYDLFISYASEQRETILKPLSAKLHALGISVWVDVDAGIPAFTEIGDELSKALDHARCLCAIFSKEYLVKYWTVRELDEINSINRFSDFPFIPLIYGMSVDQLENFEEVWKEYGHWLTEFDIFEVNKKNLEQTSIMIKYFLEEARLIGQDAQYIPGSCIDAKSDLTNTSGELKQVSSAEPLQTDPRNVKKHDLFIFYAQEDRQRIVKPVTAKLNSIGISVWDVDDEFTADSGNRKDIFDVIDHSNCLCALISKNYLERDSTIRELDELRRLYQFANLPVLPLLFDVSIEEARNYVKKRLYRGEELSNWLNQTSCAKVSEANIMDIAREIKAFILKAPSRACLIP